MKRTTAGATKKRGSRRKLGDGTSGHEPKPTAVGHRRRPPPSLTGGATSSDGTDPSPPQERSTAKALHTPERPPRQAAQPRSHARMLCLYNKKRAVVHNNEERFVNNAVLLDMDDPGRIVHVLQDKPPNRGVQSPHPHDKCHVEAGTVYSGVELHSEDAPCGLHYEKDLGSVDSEFEFDVDSFNLVKELTDSFLHEFCGNGPTHGSFLLRFGHRVDRKQDGSALHLVCFVDGRGSEFLVKFWNFPNKAIDKLFNVSNMNKDARFLLLHASGNTYKGKFYMSIDMLKHGLIVPVAGLKWQTPAAVEQLDFNVLEVQSIAVEQATLIVQRSSHQAGSNATIPRKQCLTLPGKHYNTVFNMEGREVMQAGLKAVNEACKGGLFRVALSSDGSIQEIVEVTNTGS